MIVLIIALLILSACNTFFPTNKQFNVALPYTALFRNYPNYLVSTDLYMKFYEKKDITSNVINIIRKGDVFVLVRFQGKDTLGYHWYEVRNEKQRGWVLSLKPILVHSLEEAEFTNKHISLQK